MRTTTKLEVTICLKYLITGARAHGASCIISQLLVPNLAQLVSHRQYT